MLKNIDYIENDATTAVHHFSTDTSAPVTQIMNPIPTSITQPASRDTDISLQLPQAVTQSILRKPNHLLTVGKNVTSSEVCFVELHPNGVRTEHESSTFSLHNIIAQSDLTETIQLNSSSEKIAKITVSEKKSTIILPASRESLVPSQPPQTSCKPLARVSQAFPTAPKVMVRKFDLAYNSQTNTHILNKFQSKLRNSDEDRKNTLSESLSSPLVLASEHVNPVNLELCSSGGKLQLKKVNSSEINSIIECLEKPPPASVENSTSISTVGVVPVTCSAQKTISTLKLVPTILKRTPPKTVLTPSGSVTMDSIPSAGPRTALPVIVVNNKEAMGTSAAKKPVVSFSLAGKSVITKDNKVFNIKVVNGKCILFENMNTKTSEVSAASEQPKVIKQVDLKMLRTPKFIKVDSRNGGYILKRCLQSSEDSGVSAPKQPNTSIVNDKRPQPMEHTNQMELDYSAPSEDARDELTVCGTPVAPVEQNAVSSDFHIPGDVARDSVEWDANEILKTLDECKLETGNHLEKQDKETNKVPNAREVEIPARKIIVVDAYSQTDLYSLMEPGKIVELSISPAAKYSSGSVAKKQAVKGTSATVASMEHVPPVPVETPCLQEEQPEAKRTMFDVAGKEDRLQSNQNSNDSVKSFDQNSKLLRLHIPKEIEPVINTADSFDTALWQDILNSCSVTEIDPVQLLKGEAGLSSRANVPNESSVHDLIVKHNLVKLCNKNKLVKNDSPCGEEYFRPKCRKRKQTFPSFNKKKPENFIKQKEANIPSIEVEVSDNNNIGVSSVNGNELMDNPNLQSLVSNKILLQKLYYEWIESVIPDSDGNVELHYAVTEENVNLVRRQCMVICARKLSVDLKNDDGETPLHLAVRSGHKQITQILLNHGADPCVKNSSGNTALHLAVLAGSGGSLRALLSREGTWTLPLDVLNDEGLGPLHLCAMNGRNKQLLELLAAGASVNLEDGRSGRTALFHAVEADNNQVVRVLLAAGADSSLPNYSGHTPLHAASEVSVTDKRVMSQLITNEGLALKEGMKINKKLKNAHDSDEDEDDPERVGGRKLSIGKRI
ncbi:uncharacterized protein LOC134530611 [Bacillus rossius redtenbacheri]|uniref:uncharacterized protein LOC134530611 n=1 Tax=Bacillus rossius redtenbacheri TaxID=93214 RepID=UPI002FDD7EB7